MAEGILASLAELAREAPEREQVIDGDRRISRAVLLESAARVSDLLAAAGDTDKKSRIIALLLPNSLEFVVAFLAILWRGGIVVPLNPALRNAELHHFLKSGGIDTLIVELDQLASRDSLRKSFPDLHIIPADWSTLLPGRMTSPAEDRPHHHFPVKSGTLQQDILWLSTSGSSALPKLVRRTESAILANAVNVGRAIGIRAKNCDRFFSVVPFHHAHGFSTALMLPLLWGIPLVVSSQFVPRQTRSILRDEKITIFPGSPFIFSVLADLPEDGLGQASLRICLSSGATLPISINERFFHLYGCHIGQLYGSTESACISIRPGADEATAAGSVGSPVDGVELQIIDPTEGRALPQGASGEIIVRSPAMMVGYVNRPDLTEGVIHHHYYRTGDLGFIDERGILHLTGRRSTLINVSGIKIDPVEIEQVILSCPGVSRVCVSGVLDHRELVVLKAVVAASTSIVRSDIVVVCREHLAEFKIPKIIEIVAAGSMEISQKAGFHS